MNRKELKISESDIRSNLSYCKSSGLFRWIKSRGQMMAGKVAGTIHPEGYVIIGYDYVYVKAHRLAWFYVHGEWPKDEIDHINGIRNDNRIENLRQSTKSQNMQNKKKYSVKSDLPQSIYPGVTWSKVMRKWIARISKDGKKYYLGSFIEPEDAYKVYLENKKKLHDFYNNELR